jgi:ABC-2 type transport system permease protein
MLWYKAWLETRWRFIFSIGAMLLLFLPGPLLDAPPERLWRGIQLGGVLLYCFTAVFLAGAGINSQTSYAAMPGFHGSMLFTLSLPVSRRRLFFVRAGLGAIETCIFVAMMAGVALHWTPGGTSVAQVFAYEARAIVCTMAVYALSALLACILDEMWQFMGGCMCLGGFLMIQFRSGLVSQFSPLRGMSLWSYPATASMPWAPIIASLAITGVLVCASVLVLERKEY